MQRIYKTNDEQFPIGVDFLYRLAEGDSVVSATIAAYDATETDKSSTFLVGTTATVVGTSVTLGILKANGGVVGSLYRVDFYATTTNGYKLTGNVEVGVVAAKDLN